MTRWYITSFSADIADDGHDPLCQCEECTADWHRAVRQDRLRDEEAS